MHEYVLTSSGPAHRRSVLLKGEPGSQQQVDTLKLQTRPAPYLPSEDATVTLEAGWQGSMETSQGPLDLQVLPVLKRQGRMWMLTCDDRSLCVWGASGDAVVVSLCDFKPELVRLRTPKPYFRVILKSGAESKPGMWAEVQEPERRGGRPDCPVWGHLRVKVKPIEGLNRHV